MTADVIAPVIPPRTRPASGGGRAGSARPVPLAVPPVIAPDAPRDAVYGTGRVDASGRVSCQSVAGALGWRGGVRVTITAGEGVVLARRDPHGMVTLPVRACLVIPSALRRRCGLRPGDVVVLAAFPGRDALAAYPLSVVDRALRALAPFPGTEGATP